MTRPYGKKSLIPPGTSLSMDRMYSFREIWISAHTVDTLDAVEIEQHGCLSVKMERDLGYVALEVLNQGGFFLLWNLLLEAP